MRWVNLVAVAVLSFLSTGIWAEALTKEEATKQNEFSKAYNTIEREDRLKALKILEDATHPSTWKMLAYVAQADNYKEVRVEAFKMLSQMPAHDANLSHLLATVFASVKPNDYEVAIDMMPNMKNSEFKYEVLEAMVEFGSKLRYPDLVTGGGYTPPGMMRSGNADLNVQNRKQRAAFEKFLTILNSITNTDIKEPDKNTPLMVKKWWEPRRPKFLQADRDLTEKYAAEDRAKADKNNPLIPKGKDATSAAAAKDTQDAKVTKDAKDTKDSKAKGAVDIEKM